MNTWRGVLKGFGAATAGIVPGVGKAGIARATDTPRTFVLCMVRGTEAGAGAV